MITQAWIVHHLQIIGEAARKLSDDLRKRRPEIPWPEIVAMRNVLVHDYFTVDLEEVWAAVEQDLPELKRKIEAVLKDRWSKTRDGAVLISAMLTGLNPASRVA